MSMLRSEQVLNVASESGYFTYVSTAKRITLGEELKERNRLGDFARELPLIAGSE